MAVDVRPQESIEEVQQVRVAQGHCRIHEDLPVDEVREPLRREPREEVPGGEKLAFEVGGDRHACRHQGTGSMAPRKPTAVGGRTEKADPLDHVDAGGRCTSAKTMRSISHTPRDRPLGSR